MNRIKLKVKKDEYFEYELDCRNCCYPLPLNKIFIRDVRMDTIKIRNEKKEVIGEEIVPMVAIQCPQCNIENSVSIPNWTKLRQDWVNKKSGYSGQPENNNGS